MLNIQKSKEGSRMKIKLFLVISILTMLLSGCTNEKLYKDGEYYGEAEGYYSKVLVKVVVLNGSIMSIDIVEHNEPEILANVVFNNLPDTIIKKNSTDVDVIAGASYTSESLIKAVDIALEQSKITN